MPILEIPIDDSKFSAFAAKFSAFEKGLSDTPSLWGKVGEAQSKVFGSGSSSPIFGVEKSWKGIAGFSAGILSNTLKITGELLKWGTIIGSGLLGGSLFGITRMAGDVSGYRRSAMGLGMSIGSMRSFDVNMERLGNPGGFLSAINQAISNPALQSPLYALGVDPHGSTEQVSIAMLKAMRKLAQETPRGLLGTTSDAYQLGAFGGLEKLMILKAMGNKEFSGLLSGEQNGKSLFGLDDATALKWQKFTTQLETAGNQIFTIFVKGLVPLADPLAKLSQAFGSFLSKLLSGPLVKEGIDNLADLLNNFSAQMTSKKFQAAVDSLVSDTGTIASGLHSLATVMRDVGLGVTGNPIPGSPRAAGESFHEFALNLTGPSKNTYAGYLEGIDSKYKLPTGTLERLMMVESSGDYNALNSKTGAAGPFQYIPSTAKSRGVDPFDVFAVGNDAGKYLSQLRAQFGNLDAALAAYGGFSGVHVGETRANMPRRMKHYVVGASAPDSGVIVRVTHKTGANPVLAAQGLGAGP
jgi:hypothetical protein